MGMEVKKGIIARMKQDRLDKNFEIHIHPEQYHRGIPQKFPLHWHEYYELEILMNGHATEYVNDKIIQLKKGSFSFLTTSACHSVELDSEAILINIRMRERFFNGFDAIKSEIEIPGGALFGSFSPEDYDRILYICQIIREDMEKTKILSDANKNLVFYILRKLLENQSESFRNNSIEKQISDVLFYINHNFTKKITVESTAKEFGFAGNYFGKKFFSQVGISFNDYVNNARLNYGYSLIIDNEQTIEEVANACGFSDRTYFSTLFRKKFGMSPARCRELSYEKFKVQGNAKV